MRIESRLGVLGLVLAVAGAGAACAGNTENGEAGADAGAPAAAVAEKAAPTVDDAEIAAIVVAANRIDVRYGEIAKERAVDERVKQFAQTMITDHNAVNQSAAELVGRLGVTPRENDVSRSLESGADATRASLMQKSGAAFDLAYIENEVAYHSAVLSAIDDLLIPSAQNAELKQTLVSVRPAIEAHLRHAESLKRSLSGS